MTVTSILNQIVRPLESGDRLKPDEVAKRARPPVRGIRDLPASLLGRRYGLRFGVETKIIKSALTLRDDVLDRHIVVDVHWHAKLKGDASRLLDKLAVSEDDAQQVIETAMTASLNVKARGRGNVQLGQWLHNCRIELARHLTDLLATLDLEVWCELRTSEHKLTTVTIPAFSFDVRTGDSGTLLRLTLDMLLDPTEHASELAPKHVDAWQKELRAIAIDYMQRHESIESYYRDSQLASRLRAPLDQKVESYRWKIIRFGITTQQLPATASISDIFRVEWTSADHKVFGFGVKVSLEIAPRGIPLFDKHGWPELRAWTQENLQACFKEVLFDRDKDKLSPSNFEEIRAELQQCLQNRAQRIGLTVRTLIPDPQIPEWEYLSDREYKVPAQDYASHNATQNVNFEMTLTGRFSTIGAVFKAKNSAVELKELIAQVAAEAAANQMQQEEPSTYFSAFMPPPPQMPSPPAVPADGYLRDRLANVVGLALSDRLGFEVRKVHILRRDPEVARRIQEICDMPPREFKVKILPEGAEGPDSAIPMTLQVQFVPPPAEYMANYMNHNLTPDKLTSQVQAKIEQILDGMPLQELSIPSEAEKLTLRNRLRDRVNQEMTGRGICVSIESIKRAMSDVAVESYRVKVSNPLKVRRHQSDRFDERLQHLDEKFAALRKKELDAIEKGDLDARELEEEQQKLLREQREMAQQAETEYRQLGHDDSGEPRP